MSGETSITVIGNLTADPELRFTPSGAAVANGTIASTPRTFDKASNEWKDGETLFVRYSAWRELGENITESLVKGQRVVATGFLKPNNYETKEGEKRTGYELDVQEMGPSLKYAKAVVTRTPNGNGGGGQQGGFQQPQQGQQGGYQQQQAPAQQGGYQQPAQSQQGGNWNQTAAQQAVTQQAGGQYAGGSMAQGQQQQQDPWAAPAQQQGQWGNGQPQGNGNAGEPPF